MTFLGQMIFNGKIKSIDQNEAVTYFKTAANSGNPISMLYYGNMESILSKDQQMKETSKHH